MFEPKDRCECEGQCGLQHPTGQCRIPDDERIQIAVIDQRFWVYATKESEESHDWRSALTVKLRTVLLKWQDDFVCADSWDVCDFCMPGFLENTNGAYVAVENNVKALSVNEEKGQLSLFGD